ncbi:MAG: glycosyltransferase family 2 protein [Candidatus Dojkabacteria bacterium]
MKILAIIVNYNGKQLLERNIPSLVSTYQPDLDICVVDNNSSDDSILFLEKEHPEIKILKSDKNLGYGRAHNLALNKYPDYQYYIFMNNDLSLEPDWLSNLLEVMQVKQNVGAVGPKILLAKKKDGKYVINSAGLEIDKHYMAYDRYEGENDDGKYSQTEKVDGICGAVMLVSRKVLDKVKGFNSKMFLYYEDVDLSLRIRDAGYNIYYRGKSVVYHDHMASTANLGSSKRNQMNMKNRYISIKNRLGFFVAIKETVWYLYNWITWKTFHSKKLTLREYLNDK